MFWIIYLYFSAFTNSKCWWFKVGFHRFQQNSLVLRNISGRMDIWGYSLSEIQGLFSRKQQRVVLADVFWHKKKLHFFRWSMKSEESTQEVNSSEFCPLYHSTASLCCEVQMILDASMEEVSSLELPRPTITRWAWISPRRRRKRRIETWVNVFGYVCCLLNFTKFIIHPLAKIENKSCWWWLLPRNLHTRYQLI